MSESKDIDMEKLVNEIRDQVWDEIGKAYASKMQELKDWNKTWNKE